MVDNDVHDADIQRMMTLVLKLKMMIKKIMLVREVMRMRLMVRGRETRDHGDGHGRICGQAILSRSRV